MHQGGHFVFNELLFLYWQYVIINLSGFGTSIIQAMKQVYNSMCWFITAHNLSWKNTDFFVVLMVCDTDINRYYSSMLEPEYCLNRKWLENGFLSWTQSFDGFQCFVNDLSMFIFHMYCYVWVLQVCWLAESLSKRTYVWCLTFEALFSYEWHPA